jgi:general secretion pathway protein K
MTGRIEPISKRFFLKKEAKTFARLSPASPRQPRKRFSVLYFKKELLSSSDQGFALLIVLWTLVMLALLTAQITGAGRSEAVMAASLRESAQLQQAADGAVYETIWHMLDGGGDYWPPGAGQREMREPGAVVTVTIEDERGKMDINQVPVQLLAGLFAALGTDNDTATALSGAIGDWRSQAAPGDQQDNVPAEYRMEGRAWGPPGQEFERLDELLLVRGITPQLYQAARPYLTLALEQGPWLQYADPMVLNAIARAKRLGGVAVDSPDTRGPTVLRLIAVANGPGGTKFVRNVLFRLDGTLSGPAWKYRILQWE